MLAGDEIAKDGTGCSPEESMTQRPRGRERPRIPSFWVLGLGVVVASCRFGASPTDPYTDAPLTAAKGGAGGHGAGDSTETGGSDDTGGSDGAGGTDGTGGSSDTGGAGESGGTSDAGGTSNAGGAATGGRGSAGGDAGTVATGGSEGGMPSTPGACQPATPPAICDPVKNFGCLVPFSFCDIDTAQVIATGRCVFPWSSTAPAPTPPACFMDVTTDTCMPTSSCVNGTCRKLCYCDSDCQPGDCCTEPAPGASTAFKLCKPC